MSTDTKFFNLLKAGYAVLWVQTHEEDRCIADLRHQANVYESYSWDLLSGLAFLDKPSQPEDMPDPILPIQKMESLPETSILFLKDFHKFMSSVEVFRALKNAIQKMKANDKHIVIVSPVLDIPTELEKDITVMEFHLPSIDDLMAVARNLASDNDLAIDIEESDIAAAKGLTLMEAEDAMALSLITHGRFDRGTLESAKLQAVKKSGLMELYMPEPVENLGGMEGLKPYLYNRKAGFFSDTKAAPKGILLTGLPGAGKSLSAKVTASIFNLPLLKLDFASLKGSLVGESEKNIRRATQMADAIGSCVLWLDEIEKALGGVRSSSQTDGGTTSAMFGHLLTWMQETKSKVYIVGTCNDMEDLLFASQGALLRRFDDIFFVDVPTLSERIQILEIMNRRYGTQVPEDYMAKAQNWTGAEIEKFVKSSLYDGPDMAFENIHPIFEQNRENIDKMRNWAKLNARPAGKPDPVKTEPMVRKLKVSR